MMTPESVHTGRAAEVRKRNDKPHRTWRKSCLKSEIWTLPDSNRCFKIIDTLRPRFAAHVKWGRCVTLEYADGMCADIAPVIDMPHATEFERMPCVSQPVLKTMYPRKRVGNTRFAPNVGPLQRVALP